MATKILMRRVAKQGNGWLFVFDHDDFRLAADWPLKDDYVRVCEGDLTRVPVAVPGNANKAVLFVGDNHKVYGVFRDSSATELKGVRP